MKSQNTLISKYPINFFSILTISNEKTQLESRRSRRDLQYLHKNVFIWFCIKIFFSKTY
jgi:hypothetical protein